MSSSWCFPYTSRCESIELGWSVRSHTLKENWLVLYQKLPTVHSSSIWGGAHELPLSHDNMLTGWTCASFVQVNTGSWVHWSCPVEKTLFPSILHDHFQSFLPLFHDGPWSLGCTSQPFKGNPNGESRAGCIFSTLSLVQIIALLTISFTWPKN